MCDVHAEIQSGIVSDGVYALKNKATGQYLDIQYDSPNEEMLIQQYAYNNVPSSDSDRSGLFKLKHNTNNYYFIRTMRNNANSFYRNNDYEVRTCSIDPVDSNNAQSDCWKLMDAGNGYYYIKAYGIEKYLSTPASGVNSNKYCTTEGLYQAGDRAKWELILYAGSTIRGLSFVNPVTSVYMESETQYSAYMWTTDISNNGPVVWSVHQNANWSYPCYSTITSTGVLQTSTVKETIDVTANPGWTTSYCVVVQVEPPLADGIYAIMSNYSGMYLDVRSDSANTGAYIQQCIYGSTPNEESERGGLFKVKRTGSGNAYVVRTMTNNANSFKSVTNTTGSSIKTCEIDDENLGIWYITRNSQGQFVIKTNGNAYALAIGVKDNCSSGSSGDDNSKLELTNVQSEKAKWLFVKPYDLAQFEAFKVYYNNPQIIESGSSASLSPCDIGIKYYYCTNMEFNDPGQFVHFTLISPSGETQNIAYIANGVLTGFSGRAGMVSVIAHYSETISKPFNIYIKPTNGDFFILQNVQGTLGCVKSFSTYSKKVEFEYGDKQIWKKIPNGNGYYYIQNMDGKYLTAPNSSTSGANIGLSSTLLSGNDINRQLWIFDYAPSGTGAYRIKSVSMGTSLWLNISSNNSKLVQDSYVNNSSYYDEFNVVMMGTDVIYHRTFEGFAPIDVSNVVRNIYRRYNGFELVYLQNHLGNDETQSNPSACFNIALDMLQNAKIAVFAGHGSPSVITISETDNQYFLRNNHIYASNTSFVDLSSVDIVIFDGCNTASAPDQGLYNITESAAMAGAKVAIGWTVSVGANNPAGWIDMFFNLMNSVNPNTGHIYTAYDAWNKTNEDIGDDSENSQIYGTNQYFSFE